MAAFDVALSTDKNAEAYIYCHTCGEDFMIIREQDEKVPHVPATGLIEALTEHAKHCEVSSEPQPG